MRDDMDERRRWPALILIGLALTLLGGLAGWSWHSMAGRAASGIADTDRAAIEDVVRQYILDHPEILPQAMENLQRRENAKRLSAIRGDLERPFPGAVLGNPAGKVTLVEFTDFACGYCKQSVADVEALVKKHPDLRVVVRELPILSPQSAEAARMALAAAEQGRFAAFHRLMFSAGRPDTGSIEAAAKAAGLDMARARKVSVSPAVEAEINANLEMARQLGFAGTPTWVIGDSVLAGAVGLDRLDAAIRDARD
ncbi:MAG: DsbA family protein [Novosphingobium sp.]|nr:DsbA family protein [Novosphingobium sp.]